MSKPTLIDTDILIDAGRGVADAVACLNLLAANSSLSTSVISKMELTVGCRNAAELQMLNHFLTLFQIVNVNDAISDRAVD